MTPLFARAALPLIALGLVAPGTSLPAQEQPRWTTPLDLLPETAQGGLVIRSTNDLRRASNDLTRAIGISGNLLSTDWIAIGLGWLGIERKGVNEDGPLGLVFTDVAQTEHDFEALVLAVPVSNRQTIGPPLALDPEETSVFPLKGVPGDYLRCGRWTQTHLLLAGGRNLDTPQRAIQSLTTAPRLSRRLAPVVIARLNDSEILAHIGIETLARRDPNVRRDDWPGPARLERLDPDEREAATELRSAMSGLQHALFALDLEDGIHFHTRLVFPSTNDSPARPLFTALREPAGDPTTPPTLAGLPAGPVFAAFATRLTQPRQQLLLRALGKVLAQDSADLAGLLLNSPSLGALTDLRQTLLLGALAEVLPLSSELRGAIYPDPDGTFGVLVHFDCNDPQRMIDTLRELADLVSPADAGRPQPAADGVADDQFRRLTRELAADDFRTRNRAGARLLLAGVRSRQWLREATASEDPEVAARAAELLAKIEASRIQREQQLLQGVPLVGAHPHVAYQIAAAEIAGRPVDVLKLTLPESEAHLQTQLQELFGADWNRIRIVTTQQQVIVGLGSVDARLEQSLELLGRRHGGLEDDPRLARLPDDPDRLLTVHLPVSRFIPEAPRRHTWFNRPSDLSLSRALTAWGLSASDSELWFDVHFPVDELRGFAAKSGWWW